MFSMWPINWIPTKHLFRPRLESHLNYLLTVSHVLKTRDCRARGAVLKCGEGLILKMVKGAVINLDFFQVRSDSCCRPL